MVRFVEEVMVAGMGEVQNGPHSEGPSVPVEVDTQIAKTWGG